MPRKSRLEAMARKDVCPALISAITGARFANLACRALAQSAAVPARP
jgi:hypothetical protein